MLLIFYARTNLPQLYLNRFLDEFRWIITMWSGFWAKHHLNNSKGMNPIIVRLGLLSQKVQKTLGKSPKKIKPNRKSRFLVVFEPSFERQLQSPFLWHIQKIILIGNDCMPWVIFSLYIKWSMKISEYRYFFVPSFILMNEWMAALSTPLIK